MLKKSFKKRGVSVLIGYVLLVVFAVIIGGIVFTWLQSYVPAESLGCPDGTSIFIRESSFDDGLSQLNLILKNNGRFDIAGFFIYATNISTQETATIDLSGYSNNNEEIFENSIVYLFGSNSIKSGDTKISTFDIPSELGTLYSITIIPIRYQIEGNRERFVSCSNAKTENLIEGPVVCVPDCTGRVCGPDPICGESCGECGIDEFCDSVGQCILNTCTPAPDPTLSGVCGTQECGTATNGTCGEVSCGECSLYEVCDTGTFQCISTCGDGICDSWEDCTCVDCEGQQAQCEEGYICQSGSCQLDTSNISSCPGYCVLLDYSTGSCQNNPNCPQGGVYESLGDQWCTGGPNADTCCCLS